MTRNESLHHKAGEPVLSSGAEPTAGVALNPGLYVVATPIGNLNDITARALAVLRGADVIACEDTRVTGVLLHRFGIAASMMPYHDHNAEQARPKLLSQLQAGGRVALVSDAGTPLISDPGYKLVRACADAGIPVIPIPGPSALLAGLVVAGLPTDRVMFAGFLPQKSGARRGEALELKGLKATLVFYESAQRLPETLADLHAVLGPRPAAVCREMTKLYEEVRRGTLAELEAHYAAEGPPKGEIVLVIGGAPDTVTSAEDLDSALRKALATMTVRDAADVVAEAFQEPRRRIYQRALELSKDGRP
ncbi:MAG: 16S rRNA (cytidine(1402)-2'-O)-methyltransferase [Rhodospirillaceae bacterium]